MCILTMRLRQDGNPGMRCRYRKDTIISMASRRLRSAVKDIILWTEIISGGGTSRQ